MKLSKKVLIPVLVVVVLLAAYFVGLLYYNDKYLPGTSINGIAYGGKTPEQVVLAMTNPPSNRLAVLGRSNTKEGIEISQSHYIADVDEGALRTIKQEQVPYTWFAQGLIPKEYQVENKFDYDMSKVRSTLSKLQLLSEENMVLPKDAYIEETAEGFHIVPEVMGNQVDPQRFEEAVLDAISKGEETLDLEASGLYNTPELLSTDPVLMQALQQLEMLGKLVITYDFYDRQEVLAFDDFSSWVYFDPDKGIQVDEEEATAYVRGLAARYDTYFTNRQFNTTGVGTITIGGGIYGWQTDVPATTQALISMIQSGESQTVEPVYKIRGLNRGVDDIGNTYIEIDLTRQHMWYYVNGELYTETGIVSGLPGGARETPTGIGSVWSKEEKRYITADGQDFWVEYWMPVNWSGVGIHDAPWQPSFGGDRFLYSGSHGCINTPYDKVAQIFNRVDLYTPVIIYKS